MYTLPALKAKLGYENLNLTKVKTESGEPTAWLRQWDNDNRIAVVIHQDTLAKIKANPAISSLGTKDQKKSSAKGEYLVKTIVAYTEADEIL